MVQPVLFYIYVTDCILPLRLYGEHLANLNFNKKLRKELITPTFLQMIESIL
jgi:hypothetical protein